MSTVDRGDRSVCWGLPAALALLAAGQLAGCDEPGSGRASDAPAPPPAPVVSTPRTPPPAPVVSTPRTPPPAPIVEMPRTPPPAPRPAGPGSKVPEFDTAELEPRVAELLHNTRQAILDDPDSAEAWYTFGSAADSHRLQEYVAPAYREAVALEPENFRYVYNLAVALEADPRGAEESLARLQDAAALDPGYAAVWLRLGDALSRRGRREEARAAYEKALELDSEQERARRGLSQVLLASGAITEAIGVLEDLARRFPEDGPTAALLAQAYGRQGDRDRAADAARRARELEDVLIYRDPVRGRALSLGVSSYVCEERADRLVTEGNFAEAVRNLLIVAEVRPEDPQAHYKLGFAARRAGRPELARTHLAEAVTLDPELADAHRELAQVLVSTRRFDEAVARFERYRALRPDDARILWPLAAALAQAGRLPEALEQFEEAARTAPPSPRGELNWGVALMQAGNAKDAIERFQSVLEVAPDDVLAHCNLGLAYERVGLTDRALACYREAARIDPDSFGARRLQQLQRGR